MSRKLAKVVRKSVTLNEVAEERLTYIKKLGEYETDSQVMRAALRHMQSNITRQIQGYKIMIVSPDGEQTTMMENLVDTVPVLP